MKRRLPTAVVVFISLIMIALAIPSLALAKSVYTVHPGFLDRIETLPTKDKTVILTFEGGPSEYTSQILDILREKQVKATFFVVGTQVIKNPHILNQLVAEGHEIGNLTYNQVDLADKPQWLSNLEINLNRLVIQSQINRSTRLFRPPFLQSGPIDRKTKRVLLQAGRYGYLTVGIDIDGRDESRPRAYRIAQNTIGSGGIIRLHDGGEDRRQTVKALSTIIDYYRSRGYQFVTVGESLGLGRSAIMPPLNRSDALISDLVASIIIMSRIFLLLLHGVITLLSVAVVGRLTFLLVTSVIQHTRSKTLPPPETSGYRCSVMVPAYNEEAVIEACLKSILSSDYRDFELVVVNDGSTDNTHAIASKINDRRLRVVGKANGGKSSALNYGIASATSEIIVAVDADTVFKKDTLSRLVGHFVDPSVGAVSGNTRVANTHKLLTKLQSLEYVVEFNLNRRMGDLLDCITVVPGAVGAFRVSAIREIGGFSSETLAEDTDMTLSIKENGFRIVYEPRAIAFTEAPATLGSLLKQRFRWAFGTMQATWKHRRSFLNPRMGTLGMVGLPYLVFYQIVFPIVSPLLDLMLFLALATGSYDLVGAGLVLYGLGDIFISALALRMEGERLRQLWLIIPQRLIYRQLMYYVILRSLYSALKGQLVQWGKLKRDGRGLARV